MKVIYAFDTTPVFPSRVAIWEGGSKPTLLEAVVLVFLIMLPLPRQPARDAGAPTHRGCRSWPASATFGVLGLFGFSINMLTMFAMVLAIGLLVDDAIVGGGRESPSSA